MTQTRKIGVCDTTFRDAHQSLLATRLTTADILQLAAEMDKAGFAAMEVWGGATFDSCMRFLNEDPWERLRKIRAAMPNTKLQMLLRGQNLVGYRHYADDVVDMFVEKSLENGIDIIRVFDALNDPRNVERAFAAVKKAGGQLQGALSYTCSPVHDLEYFANLARTYKDMGADSICIKDMAGILHPYDAFELVSLIKQKTGLPLQMHSHYTSGMAAMTYLKAVEAGADILDCALSSVALSTSQPAGETIAASLKGTPYDTGLDLEQLALLSERMKEIRIKYKAFDVADPRVDVNVLLYQMPGGMISNFISQLQQSNAIGKLPAVLEEVPRVRKELGYPPLVTPSSQIVGTQAVLNVLGGERYKIASNETKSYLRGEYGAAPGPVDEEIRRKVIGSAEVVSVRPADLLPPQLEQGREELGDLMESPEDLLSYCIFPQVGRKFFEDRRAARDRGKNENDKIESASFNWDGHKFF
ncbi:MAG: pyruvate carboxylase subunit B [Clostridiales bacterium]|nr:pyruvate carboxylase subunit B [Clostridiales bacterium]